MFTPAGLSKEEQRYDHFFIRNKDGRVGGIEIGEQDYFQGSLTDIFQDGKSFQRKTRRADQTWGNSKMSEQSDEGPDNAAEDDNTGDSQIIINLTNNPAITSWR